MNIQRKALYLVLPIVLLSLFSIKSYSQTTNAYIGNEFDNTVTVIDVASGLVIDAVDVGEAPGSPVCKANGREVYIPQLVEEFVSVIDTNLNVTTQTIPTGAGTNSINGVIGPDGLLLYLANNSAPEITIVDTITNTLVGSIPLPNDAFDLAFTPDGTFLYASIPNNDEVIVIRTSDNQIVDTIPVGNTPLYIVMLPNGQFAYVPNRPDSTVSVIRTSDNTVVDTINVGSNPIGIDASNDGQFVYVTSRDDHVLTVIRTSDNTVIQNIPVGLNPAGVGVTPDGSQIYVTNAVSDDVSVIDSATNTVINTIDVGNGPNANINFFCIVPEEAPIPTLSQWGLIAMAGLLGIVGFMVIRRRQVTA